MTVAFLSPWLLVALVVLPAIWLLLRAVPPQPQRIVFPATRILKGLQAGEQTPHHTPWWLTALRMLAAALVILAFAEPVLDRQPARLTARGPLVLAMDNGWAAAAHWQEHSREALRLIEEAERAGSPVLLAPTVKDARAAPPRLRSGREARDALAALVPQPVAPARAETAAAIEVALAGQGAANIVWLSDGIAGPDGPAFAARLEDLAGAAGALTVLRPGSGGEALGLVSQIASGGALELRVLR